MNSYLVGAYNKIPNEIRERLVEMVVVENKTIKNSAAELRLKYSTAKTIHSIYKKDNRTCKYTSRSRNPDAPPESIKRIIKVLPPTFSQTFDKRYTSICNVVCLKKIKKIRIQNTKRNLNLSNMQIPSNNDVQSDLSIKEKQLYHFKLQKDLDTSAQFLDEKMNSKQQKNNMINQEFEEINQQLLPSFKSLSEFEVLKQQNSEMRKLSYLDQASFSRTLKLHSNIGNFAEQINNENSDRLPKYEQIAKQEERVQNYKVNQDFKNEECKNGNEKRDQALVKTLTLNNKNIGEHKTIQPYNKNNKKCLIKFKKFITVPI